MVPAYKQELRIRRLGPAPPFSHQSWGCGLSVKFSRSDRKLRFYVVPAYKHELRIRRLGSAPPVSPQSWGCGFSVKSFRSDRKLRFYVLPACECGHGIRRLGSARLFLSFLSLGVVSSVSVPLEQTKTSGSACCRHANMNSGSGDWVQLLCSFFSVRVVGTMSGPANKVEKPEVLHATCVWT